MVELLLELRIVVVAHRLRRRLAHPGAAVDRLDEPAQLLACRAHGFVIAAADAIELFRREPRLDGLLRPALLADDLAQKPVVALGGGVPGDAPRRQEQQGEKVAHIVPPDRW